MGPQIAQAQQQVNPIYDPAVQDIQKQIPAVQQLYGALLQGLQAQTQNQVNNVVNSAAQRGVGSAGIAQGAQDALGSTMALQGAQLGSQQAQTQADLSGLVGKANVARGQSTIDLASSLQRQALEQQQNQFTMNDLARKAALEQQQNQQQYNVQEAQYRTAQAKAAAAAAKAASQAASKLDLETFVSTTKATLNKLVGGDGKVSPDTWKKAMGLWVEKGLPASDFINTYSGYINKSHIQDYFKR